MQDDERKIDSYKTLKVYQKTICIFDITCYFVERFLDRGHDRTVDQMQQAARSGKQNIVEGYSDAETLAMLHGYIKFINRNWNRAALRSSGIGREFNIGMVGLVGNKNLTHLLPLPNLPHLPHL